LNTLAYGFFVLILALIHNLLMSISEYDVYHFRHHRRASTDVPWLSNWWKRRRRDW